MKHKTAQLEGALLDAAVARALGAGYALDRGSNPPRAMRIDSTSGMYFPFMPSSKWGEGGPLIERERIATWDNGALHPPEDCTWTAGIQPEGDETANDLGIFALWMHVGPTPLIAAMRAYVASKLGEEVELP